MNKILACEFNIQVQVKTNSQCILVHQSIHSATQHCIVLQTKFNILFLPEDYNKKINNWGTICEGYEVTDPSQCS